MVDVDSNDVDGDGDTADDCEPNLLIGLYYHKCTWWWKLLRQFGLRCPHKRMRVVPSRYAPGSTDGYEVGAWQEGGKDTDNVEH
jgi:hypothetical protein